MLFRIANASPQHLCIGEQTLPVGASLWRSETVKFAARHTVQINQDLAVSSYEYLVFNPK